MDANALPADRRDAELHAALNTPIPDSCDVLVVGGGINGVGIARDLTGRGFKVLLVEQHDLAAHTSSSSTKLIHGGLRYLEHREFALVRKALQEREVLLRSAPHIMKPLRFVMPHDPHMRPAWLIRLGLFLYDHLARREVLPGSRGVALRGHRLGAPLQARFKRGFVYSDGWVDDARLVVLNAMDARERGATVLTRTRCVQATRGEQGWSVRLQREAVAPGAQHTLHTVKARMLVNAAGPWAHAFLREVASAPGGEALTRHSLRLVKGSHIVVPRLFEHEHAYIFQAQDGRIIFAIPYERNFTLIGTTDVEVPSMPDKARITEEETAYLCEQASAYFRAPVRPDMVLWSYAGVRPLLEDAHADASAVTRDYLLETCTHGAPLMTVWGGKITTYRKLAEEAATQIGEMLGDDRRAWTRNARLPGGNLDAWIGPALRPDRDMLAFASRWQHKHPWLPVKVAERWVRAYGARAERILDGASSVADLGGEVAPGVYECELRYLLRHEWARSGDDVLWRRSKLGLHLTAQQCQHVQAWVASALSGVVQAASGIPASPGSIPSHAEMARESVIVRTA
ncbi:MAG TPA: glycerol-3-phosphate dehydrogenase [Candidatus Aquabacterium excrementipullorum]|nr:glycerol-3-phosphate dehydrogenase [Candidatus Aquabacterium excrementipullorum]